MGGGVVRKQVAFDLEKCLEYAKAFADSAEGNQGLLTKVAKNICKHLNSGRYHADKRQDFAFKCQVFSEYFDNAGFENAQ